jgi:hypothetical protein
MLQDIEQQDQSLDDLINKPPQPQVTP